MPEHAPTLQLIGVTVLAVAAVVWAGVLLRLLRRAGLGAGAAGARRRTVPLPALPLPAVPRQTRVGPPRESVELTPAEQDAFAGLVRHLANG
ncbi:hypothetical protein AB0E62_07960 [Streptomyces sp. NPDC038707]|uniref:hypothetical protein n=1 Tax=Streptomyces sp. NPDC038707 TaxID=3154329 RepID=UPI0033D7E96D